MVAFILSIIAICLMNIIGSLPGLLGATFLSIASLMAIIAIYIGSKEFITAKEDRIKWRALAGIIISVCVELESTLIYVIMHKDLVSTFVK